MLYVILPLASLGLVHSIDQICYDGGSAGVSGYIGRDLNRPGHPRYRGQAKVMLPDAFNPRASALRTRFWCAKTNCKNSRDGSGVIIYTYVRGILHRTCQVARAFPRHIRTEPSNIEHVH